jgi:hypothetical protein
MASMRLRMLQRPIPSHERLDCCVVFTGVLRGTCFCGMGIAMKFTVTYLREYVGQIECQELSEARATALRVWGDDIKLLSIVPYTPGVAPKPPTPFGKPPSGTLGGGETVQIDPPVDQIAEAA